MPSSKTETIARWTNSGNAARIVRKLMVEGLFYITIVLKPTVPSPVLKNINLR